MPRQRILAEVDAVTDRDLAQTICDELESRASKSSSGWTVVPAVTVAGVYVCVTVLDQIVWDNESDNSGVDEMTIATEMTDVEIAIRHMVDALRPMAAPQ